MENKLEVELIDAQLLDFKLEDGNIIKGLKVFYHDSSDSENFINGGIANTFFSYDRMSDYEDKYKQLKEYYYSCRKNGVVPHITLCYINKSIKSKPTITKIEIRNSK